MLNFDEIRNYWEGRASGDDTVQSTTQDVYLREIELNTLTDRIRKHSPLSVADMGCGDGRTTIGLARLFGNSQFTGYDYSTAMIENSKKVLAGQYYLNVNFEQQDVCNKLAGSFDLIYTTRCLINLPSWELQKIAIRNIHDALNRDGIFLMIENFVEGQERFNQVRSNFGLPEIPIRDHNLFFNHQALFEYASDLFEVVEEVNISSTYYLVSRVVYSKLCADSNAEPDYFDAHHRYAAQLPFSGEYGPVRLIVFKKVRVPHESQ